MDLDHGHDPGLGLNFRVSAIDPPIPMDGLDHVLRTWIGRGRLLPVLDAISTDADIERRWDARDTQRRADLVLFNEVAPIIKGWPSTPQGWRDLVPAQSAAVRSVARVPTAATSWADSMRRFGWPPNGFVVRERHRSADEILTTVLAWTLRRLIAVVYSAALCDPACMDPLARQISAIESVISTEPLIAVDDIEPETSEIRAVRREGAIWSTVADVAMTLLASKDPAVLARKLLEPVPELRPKFFQLAILGLVLLQLQRQQAKIVSLRPIGGGSGAEQYHVFEAGNDLPWHLWFEAAGIWSRYGVDSPYRNLASVFSGRTRPLSADILLIKPGARALILECKYSSAPEYVGRVGLPQAAFYANELLGRLCPVVEAYVVAPQGLTSGTHFEKLATGLLGICGPGDLAYLLSSFLVGYNSDSILHSHIVT
jgi:hypothetical protein